MTAEIRIIAVETRADLKRFVRMPTMLYADDSNWVQPLEIERLELLSEKKNPFFEHAEAQYWIAVQGDKDVGRISAQIDRLVLENIDQHLGQFGMFESIDNQGVAIALFQAAEAWLRDKGIQRLRGPYNLSVNEECGLLVNGFDMPPMIMMGHARPYYETLIHGVGCKQIKELYAYCLDVRLEFPEKVRRVVKIAERNNRVRIRHLDKKNFDRDLESIFSIFNEAWADNWGFVPFTKAEARHAAKQMKPILKSHLVQLCEIEGEIAAFMITIPDMNDWIKDLNGKLLPFGWAKLLWRVMRFRPKRMRVPLMGVRKKYQNGPMAGAMAYIMIEHIRAAGVARGAEFGEISWILEDNLAMMSIAKQIDSQRYKTYRIYEKELG